jgi:hypothetical protein
MKAFGTPQFRKMITSQLEVVESIREMDRTNYVLRDNQGIIFRFHTTQQDVKNREITCDQDGIELIQRSPELAALIIDALFPNTQN